MDFILLDDVKIVTVGSSGPVTTKDGAAVRLGRITTREGAVLAVQQDDRWYAWRTPAGSSTPGQARAELLAALSGNGQIGDEVSPGRLLPPLLPHRNMMCLGKNYRAHAAEFSAYAGESESLPAAPIVFTKPAAALCGARDEIMVDPEVTAALDYEVELGIVIGLGGSHVHEREATRHVAGYTVVNDVTARDLQRRHQQWFLGKSLAAATPTGPVIASPDEVPDLAGRAIRCWVNGELRQDATLGEMIFGIRETVAAISRIFPLEPGDIIAMGTPSGVGVGFDPPRFLQDGDHVLCEIEGIGRLDNTIRFVAAPHDALKEPAHAR